MKRIITIAVIVISLFTTIATAQEQYEITKVKRKAGNVYFMHGIPLFYDQLYEICRSNPDAFKEMKSANLKYSLALGSACLGGYCLGSVCAGVLLDEGVDWVQTGIAVCAIGATIPLIISYAKDIDEAVEIYNKGLLQSGDLGFNVGFTPTGIGISMTF